jgi:hypothetical protein
MNQEQELDKVKITEKDIMEVMHSLKIIAATREYDKLLTKRGLFIDQCENYWQPFTRWLYAENRQQNVDFISSVFYKAFDMCFFLLERRAEMHTAKQGGMQWLQNTQTLTRLTAEIKNAQRGLSNLVVTYTDDTHTVSRIVLLIEKVQDKLQQVHMNHGEEETRKSSA